MSQHTSETCKNKTHVGLWERIMSEQVSEHMQVVMSNKCPYIHTCQNMCVTTRARLQELMSQHMSEYMFTSSEHVSANIETHARLDVTTYVRMHSRTNVRLHRQSICPVLRHARTNLRTRARLDFRTCQNTCQKTCQNKYQNTRKH